MNDDLKFWLIFASTVTVVWGVLQYSNNFVPIPAKPEGKLITFPGGPGAVFTPPAAPVVG